MAPALRSVALAAVVQALIGTAASADVPCAAFDVLQQHSTSAVPPRLTPVIIAFVSDAPRRVLDGYHDALVCRGSQMSAPSYNIKMLTGRVPLEYRTVLETSRQIWWPQPPQHGVSPIHLCVPIWAYDDRYLGQPIVEHVVAGPYHLVRNPTFLEDYSIEVILCIRDPSEKQFIRPRELPGIEFRFLDVPTDVFKASILPHFAEANSVIAGLVAARRNVLVCCSDGIDKSAAFVAAYLMETYALKANDAVTFVQNQRYCATPSVNGYRIKLLEYEPICAARAAAGVGASMDADGANCLRRRAEEDPEADSAMEATPQLYSDTGGLPNRPLASAHKRRAR